MVYKKHDTMKGKAMIGLSCIALLAFIWVFPSWKKPSLWVSHHYGQTTLVAMHSTGIHFYSDSDALPSSLVTAYKHRAGQGNHQIEKLQQAYWWGTQPLVIIDDRWVNTAPLHANAIVVLSQNPKINLERLLYKYCPSMVIIDGSNRLYFVRQWQKTQHALGIPYHNTAQKGAYAISLGNAE